MAIRVYRVAVVGCPRSAVTDQASTSFKGVGKSCLCNRFVRPEAYTEAHDSLMCEDDWKDRPIFNGDHFIYWGAATKHLHDGSKVRFQIVEHTEFYDVENTDKLCAHPADDDYITRASTIRFTSRSSSKIAYRLLAEQVHAARNVGPIRATQLFPSEDFGGKAGVYGYICVFDPTLEGEQMKKQLDYLAELLHMLSKKKRKVVIACVKCDAVEETKIRYGSNLATYAAKKPIPFFEVSSREGVNVEDVFYSLIGPPKKRKPLPKNGRHSASPTGYPTYKEAISLRKNDLNRARDLYRKLLQREVTNFSSVWTEMFPVLEREPEFSAVLHLGGKEGKEIVKKMFCLRLIEIKLMEATKLYGFSSAKKKLDKDQSRSHQVYLSESFKGHPDLGTESLYDYVYSPTVPSDEGFELPRDNSDLTDHSTISSSRQDTPDGIKPFTPSPLHYSHGNGRLPIPLPPRPRSATCGSYPRYSHGGDSIMLLNDTPPSRKKSVSIAEFENETDAPPLPSRDHRIPIIQSIGKIPSSQSQPFLDVDLIPGKLKREGEAKRLSNSMEILLLPEADKTDSEAEPYMEPIHIQRVLGALPPLPVPANNKRDSPNFRSMRVPNRSSRPMLPKLHTMDSSNSSGSSLGRVASMQSRGHRRTRSNPWVLESKLSTELVLPPAVPPRVVGPTNVPPPVPPRDTHKRKTSKTPPPPSRKASDGDVMSPIESSLDFPKGDNFFWRGMPLPSIVTGQEVDDDNISTISGPFDEIDDGKRKTGITGHGERIVSTSELSPHHSLPRHSATSLPPDEGSDDDDPNNQYAKIDEFQQYMAMAPASTSASSLMTNHSSTFPLSHSPTHNETDDTLTRNKSQHKRFSKKILGSDYPRTLSSNTFTHSSRPISSIWKRKTVDPVIPESVDHRRTSSTSLHSIKSPRRSPRSERRPLPPSPTKGMKGDPAKKISMGANIYEVIDEDFVARVKSRRMISDDGSIPEWAPPVDPPYLAAYLKIVQQFFSIPEVHKQWVETVNSLVPDAILENFPPPFYEPPKEDDRDEEENDGELQPFVDKETESEGSPSVEESPKPKPKRQQSDNEIPIVLSPLAPALSPHLFQHSPKSPFVATRVVPASSPLVLKKVESRDDMIAMMNQMNSSDSSDDDDSESEDSNDSDTEGDTDTDCDQLDHEDHKDHGEDHEDQSQHDTDSTQHQDHCNTNNNNHDQILLNIVQTDLDLVASALRSSVSTDSDLASDAVKSPHSNSIEEVDHIPCSSEITGKEKSLVLVPRRRSPRRKGVLGDARNLSDSGISQTFEDVPQNFESEC